MATRFTDAGPEAEMPEAFLLTGTRALGAAPMVPVDSTVAVDSMVQAVVAFMAAVDTAAEEAIGNRISLSTSSDHLRKSWQVQLRAKPTAPD